jgi:hypothetical protein
MNKNIYKFEIKRAARLEDETWYADYLKVFEICVAGHDSMFFEELPNGFELALEKCQETVPDVDPERLKRWIRSCWLPRNKVLEVRSIIATI